MQIAGKIEKYLRLVASSQRLDRTQSGLHAAFSGSLFSYIFLYLHIWPNKGQNKHFQFYHCWGEQPQPQPQPQQ